MSRSEQLRNESYIVTCGEERIERHIRPLPPGWQEALDRDEEMRSVAS